MLDKCFSLIVSVTSRHLTLPELYNVNLIESLVIKLKNVLAYPVLSAKNIIHIPLCDIISVANKILHR